MFPPLSLSLSHFPSLRFSFSLLRLPNNQLWCLPPATPSTVRSPVTTTSPTPSPLSISAFNLMSTSVSLVSPWLIAFFGKGLAGNELTSALIPVHPQALKQARRFFFFFFFFCIVWPPHPGSFSIVWARTVLLFFAAVSPRDPKWDIDILAGSVLGLALDAPECSA